LEALAPDVAASSLLSKPHVGRYRGIEEAADVVEGNVTTLVFTAEPATAELVGDCIDRRERVYFATNQGEILSASAILLQDVIEIIKAHSELTKVRIEGHTNSRGSAAYNLDRSTRRAASVRQYLIDRGISERRLVSEGFDEAQPLDDRQVAQAWTQNRRVDFFVMERSD
jgi:OOP family OmpA-OmpF porin